MPRQLKTYVTTSGFFELAVAASTMKAALDIWGAGPDLFRRGYAKETSDAAIEATMAKPGRVLKRAVGACGAFKEHADLPDVSTWEKPERKPTPQATPSKLEPAPKREPVKAKVVKPKAAQPTAVETAAERKAVRLYEAEQMRRERRHAHIEAAERKSRERREQLIQKAETTLKAAQDAYDRRKTAISEERAKLERRALEEDERWSNQKRSLEAGLRQARK